MDKSLLFELTAIALLLMLGTTLLGFGLPGWGLIGVAALLGFSSATLRWVKTRQNACALAQA